MVSDVVVSLILACVATAGLPSASWRATIVGLAWAEVALFVVRHLKIQASGITRLMSLRLVSTDRTCSV